MEYTWIVYAFLSAIFAALVTIFAKIGLAKVDPTTATAVRAVIMAVFLVAFLSYEGKLTGAAKIFRDYKIFGFIFLSGIAGALSWLFYFVAIKAGNATLVASIDKLSLVFIFIFSLIFIQEKFSSIEYIGMGFVVLGIMIIAFGKYILNFIK